MPIWPDMSVRSDLPELMDERDSNQQLLFNTLEQFRSINRLITPCRRLFRSHFLAQMKRDRNRQWTLLDIGAGGCDLGLWFEGLCRTHNIQLRLTCLDHDPRVVEFARAKCAGVAAIEILQADALQLADRHWDFVFANHLLHHLADEQIVNILRRIDAVSLRQFVISDIHRSHFNYFGYSALAGVCFRNSFAFHDGRLSIRKAFKRREVSVLAARAGLSHRVDVSFCFPGHLSIVSQVKDSDS